MIPFSKYIQLLGNEVDGMNEDNILQLRDAQYKFAQAAFVEWRKEHPTFQKNVEKPL